MNSSPVSRADFSTIFVQKPTFLSVPAVHRVVAFISISSSLLFPSKPTFLHIWAVKCLLKGCRVSERKHRHTASVAIVRSYLFWHLSAYSWPLRFDKSHISAVVLTSDCLHGLAKDVWLS